MFDKYKKNMNKVIKKMPAIDSAIDCGIDCGKKLKIN
jgi:hypothetical protein